MENKPALTTDVEQFFSMMKPNEVPGLIHFHEKKDSENFHNDLVHKADDSPVIKIITLLVVVLFIIIVIIAAYFHETTITTVGFALLGSLIFWGISYGYMLATLRNEVIRLERNISMYTSKDDFIAAHSKFLLQYINNLEKYTVMYPSTQELLNFGIRLAEVPFSELRDNPATRVRYDDIVQNYWRLVHRAHHEFEDSLVAIFGLELGDLVGAWERHEKIFEMINFQNIHVGHMYFTLVELLKEEKV